MVTAREGQGVKGRERKTTWGEDKCMVMGLAESIVLREKNQKQEDHT